MTLKTHSTRALRDLALLAGASLAAASIWASNLPEEGYLLDARMWQNEVASSTSGHWPADGWYRLVPSDNAVDVQSVKPGAAATGAPADAMYFRLGGTALKEGERKKYRFSSYIGKPKYGQQYELSLLKYRFGVNVQPGIKGMRYNISYGGKTYSYEFGPFDATRTAINAVADLDGDSRPDFLVDVQDQTYLLLSSQARPGLNVPTAELWAAKAD